MKQRRICKRCHRLRVVNDVSYCAYCTDALRKMEQRRAPVDGVSVVSEALAATLEKEHALAQASTEPPPPEGRS
jgi:hypothetical protein